MRALSRQPGGIAYFIFDRQIEQTPHALVNLPTTPRVSLDGRYLLVAEQNGWRVLEGAERKPVTPVLPHNSALVSPVFRGDGLAQTIQASVQPLAGIELGVRNEAAGIIEDGVEEDLEFAAAGALNIGAKQHVGLPDLIAGLGFELLVRGWDQQLPLGETALFEEAIQRGGRHAGSVAAGR